MNVTKRIVLAVCILHGSLSAKKPFETMTVLQQYADSLPEYVDIDNDNWLNPDFSTYHKKITPGIVGRFFGWVGVGKKAWSIQGFKELIETVIKKRELAGWMGNFVQKYIPQKGDRIFIWTDLFGAFHSLVRDLVELQAKGIVDEQFKLVNPNDLFVFNGDVVNHSPYVLETLTVVMRLMEANPDQVIYTLGDHEDYQEWHSYGLARELQIRAAGVTHELIPLNKTVTRFFNTLPLALMLPEVTAQNINVVLITNNSRSDSDINAKQIAGFFEKKENKRLTSLKLDNKMPSEKKIKVRAIIMGEDRSTSYRHTTGLAMSGTKGEATAWLVFSSPTGRNRRLYDFFYDAFAKLSITNGLSDWTISLLHQDVRMFHGFQDVATYNLLTGQPIKEGHETITRIAPQDQQEPKTVLEKKEVLADEPKEMDEQPQAQLQPAYDGDKTEVTFGSTMDLSKSASTIGKSFKEGMDLAFSKMMREGGVGAFIPRVVVYDDEYTPSITRKHISNFMDNLAIDIVINSVGSPTNQVYIPFAKEGKLLNLFPYTGAPIFREPALDHFAHYRVGYVDEGRALADYVLEIIKPKKIVIFYQNDAFGKGALQGAMEILDKQGFKDVVQVPYERNDVRLEMEAKKIAEVDPDTIFFFAVTPSAKSLIHKLGVQFFQGKNLIGMSVYDESFDRFLESKGLQFLMVRMVPNPSTSDLEIVKEYREEAKKANYRPNLVGLEAYINTSILFDILKRIQPPLTQDKIIDEFKKIKNYNFKGLELDYNASTHELGKSLWLDSGDDAWIEKKVRESEQKEGGEQKLSIKKNNRKKSERVPLSEKELRIS